jgi:hypothetical protein
LRSVAFIVAAGAVGSIACGAPQSEPKAESKAEDGPYAIHVYVGSDGDRKRLDLGPVPELDAPARAASAGQANGAGTQSIRPLADDGQIAQEPTVDAPGTDPSKTAWALVAGAAVECGEYYLNIPPWQMWRTFGGRDDYYQRWFIWSELVPQAAAGLLEREEHLLCIADKLAEIADAVGPVVWRHEGARGAFKNYADAGAATYEPGSVTTEYPDLAKVWTIPPQADKDRFIVRDLAIYALAHIPYLDALRIAGPEGGDSSYTMNEVYARVATVGIVSPTDPWCQMAFGAYCYDTAENGGGRLPAATYPSYPPSDVPILGLIPDASGFPRPSTRPEDNHARDIARSALTIEAQILRSAARLLHDLIRRSVYSDFAGAEQRGARVMDPARANRIAWGGEGPYNSLAHAVRVLAGRWEMGPNQGDPQCGGARALDLLDKAYGADRSARADDAPVQTKTQATAAQLVERAGIVVPPCKLAGLTDLTSLRAAIAAELTAQAAAANGGIVIDPQGPHGAALRAVVNRVSDADLRFALERTYRTYRMLTNLGETSLDVCAAPSGEVAGVRLRSGIAPALTAFGGVAIEGGVARGRLSGDVMAHAAAILEASACNENTDFWSVWGTNTVTAYSGVLDSVDPTTGALRYSWRLPRVVFQGAFQIGQALERRLTQLRVRADDPQVRGNAVNDPESVARSAMAELRSWAGTGLFVATAAATSGTAVTSFNLSVTGYDGVELGATGDIGAQQRADIVKDELLFVYGAPWVAECAARLRKDCPADFASRYVVTASSAAEVNTNEALARNDAVLGPRYDLTITVPQGAAVPSFRPQLRGATTGSDHLYVIRKRDPQSTSGSGAILGTIALRRLASEALSTSFVVSPMQRELLQVVLGIGKWVGQRPPRIGDASAAKSAGYCVEDVPRELFVPLENELTSDSDAYENSWRHYLALAKEAANRADELGTQLITLDLKQDERREAAGVALGEICGDLGAIEDVQPDERGNMVSKSSDPTLGVCMGEEKVDVVFLAAVPEPLAKIHDPDGARNAAAQTTWIKDNVLRCATDAGKSNDLCAKSTLTFAGLGLVERPKPRQLSECSDITTAATTLRTGLNAGALNRALATPLASNDALKFAAQSIRLTVGFDAAWSVAYLDTKIMDSESADLWPGCLRTPGHCSPTAKTLNALFRSCPGKDVDTTPLGQCDGSTSPHADWQELNTLRWRVEGGLSFLGTVTGGLPGGMFTSPVPVFDETLRSGALSVPVVAAYHGKLEPTTAPQGWSGWRLNGSPSAYTGEGEYVPQPGEIQAMGNVYNVPERWGYFDTSALLTEIPPWYYEIYRNDRATHASLRHRGTSSAAKPSRWHAYWPDPASKTQDASFGVDGFGKFLVAMDGMRCERPAGTPDGRDPIAVEGHPRAGLVGAIKRNAFFDGSQARSTGQAVGFLGESGYRHGSGGPTTNYEAINPGGYERRLWAAPIFFALPKVPGDWKTVDEYTDGTLARFFPATNLYPSERLSAFVNAGVPNGDCGAAATLFQGLGLACIASTTQREGLVSPTPPAVTSTSSIATLEGWLGLASDAAKLQLADLYVEKIPRRVLQDFADKRVGSGSKKGLHGAEFLKLESALSALPGQWGRISSNFLQIGHAIQDVRIAMASANLAADSHLRDIALGQIRVQGQMGQATWGFMSSYSSNLGAATTSFEKGEGGGIFAFASAGAAIGSAYTSLDASLAEMNALYTQTGDVEQKRALDLSSALSQMSQTTMGAWSNTEAAMGEIRSTVTTLLAAAQALDAAEGKAQYEAAKGSGADFVVLAGRAAPIPVNTVLRRQARATDIRYRRALSTAKTLAYMARRAIEQRIGVPLSAISTRVGSLDPPASWADDVCRLGGVNYDKLRTAAAPGASQTAKDALDAQAASECADAVVGDYVGKLETFVEQYNATFPSHEGDDTAVLSLKDDLLGPAATCMSEAPNLLFDSGRLDAVSLPTDGESHGWTLRPSLASEGRSLLVLDGVALAGDRRGPNGGVAAAQDAFDATDTSRGVTWLSEAAATRVGSQVPSNVPSGVVTQDVTLDAGKYVLSWWDQARTADGRIATTAADATPYRAGVYDASWRLVVGFSGAPFFPGPQPASGATWSDRRALTFTVTTAGTYKVAFGASVPGEPRLGSVAIAQAQLEKAPPTGEPSAYVETSGSRIVVGRGCPRSSADFRALFDRRCENDGRCYYELTSPFVIDTEALRDGVSPLAGKLARGNHNFRHITVALNVVGTGVRDCEKTPTPSCFGSGYTEYTLEHDASTAGILDWNGDTRMFNFGLGRVDHGKGLTTERYITMPISSTDLGMLSQPGIEKPELRGRPLDGNYRLRIWDSASLDWSRIEDIQVVLKYRYWSRIDKDSH